MFSSKSMQELHFYQKHIISIKEHKKSFVSMAMRTEPELSEPQLVTCVKRRMLLR